MTYKIILTISIFVLVLSISYYFFKDNGCTTCFDEATKSEALPWLSADNENIYLVTKKESYKRANVADYEFLETEENYLSEIIISPNLGYEYTPSVKFKLPNQKSATLTAIDLNENEIDLGLLSYIDIVGKNISLEIESKSLNSEKIQEYYISKFNITE